MSTTPFFRLPIISFLITFCILFVQLTTKLHQLNSQGINYHYSPDFMRMIATGLFMLVIVSINLNKIKMYAFNLRNTLFVIITVILALLLLNGLAVYLSDSCATLFDIDSEQGYLNFLFWYPLISRLFTLLILFITVTVIIQLAKSLLHWQDEPCSVPLTDNAVAKRVQLIYFIAGYLAVSLLFQRYLYIAFYLYVGNSDLTEYQNMTFYLSAIMTGFLFTMYIKKPNDFSYSINGRRVFKMLFWVIIAQLIISIMVSIFTLYALQNYFIVTNSADEMDSYIDYIDYINTIINSIFAVPIITCLLTYLIGRFFLNRTNCLSDS